MNSSPTSSVSPSDSELTVFVQCKSCKQYHDCTEHYKVNDHSNKTLLAMAVGIRSPTGNVVVDLNDETLWNKTVGSSKKTDYMPTKTHLVREMKRRKCILNIKTRTGVKDKSSLLAWLTDNPIDAPADITFLTDNVLSFERTLRAVRAAEETAPNDRNHANFWRGQEPYLRLIHCILDTPEMRRKFQQSYAALTRESIDARNSTEVAPVSFWIDAAEMFRATNN
ncbi:hypothetical protein CTEN210_17842 [Chaetoceros tenuissimus]|uniref:Uncharacterized protein n=1 Tax=Chaetoceros tenuissimus TaxID=426638 RepID=A0AAD3HFH0_9STRA|nr:hypothetical protein CTEN210_17842 [Chaetoceros tenuissimus]